MASRIKVFLLMGLGAGLFMAACGDASDKFRKTESNDILLEPNLQERNGVWTSYIQFNRRPLGRSDPKRVRIRHGGATPLIVTEMFIEGYEECNRLALGLTSNQPFGGELDQKCQYSIDSGFQHISPETPLTLSNDAFQDYQVVYKATQRVPPEPTRLVIRSNALDKMEVQVTLEVQSAEARMTVSPNPIPFPPGVESTVSVNVTNSGAGQLNVFSITTTQESQLPTDSATGEPVKEFQVIEDGLGLPWQINEGETRSAQVQYRPLDAGEDDGTLILEAQTGTVEVPMSSGELIANLAVNPNPVLFEAPDGPAGVEKDVTLTNSGLRTIFVTGFTIVKADNFAEENPDYRMELESDSFQLPGGDSRLITVVYQPNGEGSPGVLRIRNDADNAVGQYTEVALRPSGGALTLLDIQPSSLNLMGVAENQTTAGSISLTAAGTTAVAVSAINIRNDSDPGFEIASGGGPIELQPGAAPHVVEIRYSRPAGSLPDALAYVEIVSNAETSPDLINVVIEP